MICRSMNCGSTRLFIFMTVITIFHYATSDTCIFKSPCECVYQNGSVINLKSLGYHDKARFENMKPLNNETYRYYYNPCFSFSLGPDNSACANGVAVCQVNNNVEYQNCGEQSHSNFLFDSKADVLHLIYTAPPRTTNVTLICSIDAIEPKLEVLGENKNQNNLYEMTLTTRCACPDLCRENHLSPGSVLVILFLVFVILYLLLGIVHSHLTRGAHGWELIPHYEFWADFPLLVRDGCVFVINGCKHETGYERI